jgi:hypothetical protein
MAEIFGGIGKKGSGRGAAAGAGNKVVLRTKKTKRIRGERRSGSKAENGAARLKEEVDRKLKSSAGELANVLLGKARGGDIPTIRLVVSLAEQHEANVEVMEKEGAWGAFVEQARAWETEPPWVEPPGWVDPDEEELKGEEGVEERVSESFGNVLI